MAPLRVCEGTVSIEQRKTKGSSAPARVQSAGAVTIAAAELMNVRRDIEDSIVLSPFLCCFAGTRRANGYFACRLVMRVLQKLSLTPDTMSRTLTAISNCRSESRLKMRKPSHAPSIAAGTNASAFQSSSIALDDDGRMR